MASYATRFDLADYIEDTEGVELPRDPAVVERLLQRAERDVDNSLGRYPDAAPGALKLDPEDLTEEQRAALARACCAAAEFRLVIDQDAQIGDEDYLPAGVAILRRAAKVSPKMLEELAGSGLRRWSGCAAPSPPLPIEEFSPAQVWPWELLP